MKGNKRNYIQNEKLLMLQDEYLKTKSLESWQQFFSLSFTVCKNIVISEFTKNKKFFTQEELYDYAINACIYVMRRYKSIGYKHKNAAPKDYCVTTNFITVLQAGVRHSMYYTTKELTDFNNALCYEEYFNYESDI